MLFVHGYGIYGREVNQHLVVRAGKVMVQGMIMSAFKVQGHLPRLSDVEPRGSMTLLIAYREAQLHVPCARTSQNAGVFAG